MPRKATRCQGQETSWAAERALGGFFWVLDGWVDVLNKLIKYLICCSKEFLSRIIIYLISFFFVFPEDLWLQWSCFDCLVVLHHGFQLFLVTSQACFDDVCCSGETHAGKHTLQQPNAKPIQIKKKQEQQVYLPERQKTSRKENTNTTWNHRKQWRQAKTIATWNQTVNI